MRRVGVSRARGFLCGALAASIGLSPIVAMAQPSPAPVDGAPAPAPAAGQYSGDELKALQDVEEDFKRYQGAAEQHQTRMKDIANRELSGRKGDVSKRYAEQRERTQAEFRKRQTEAIAKFEDFLRRYPDHPTFTPDAMFRLARLYLDEAEFEYEKKESAADAARAAATPVPAPAPDAAPDAPDVDVPTGPEAIIYEGPDYSRSLDLWRQVATRFPTYRQMDGTLYLLGYYLGQTGRDRHAKQVFLGLVCANKYDPMAEPPPAPDRAALRARIAANRKGGFTDPYADCTSREDANEGILEEAWVRGVADGHFNTPGELNESIVAYAKVAGNKQSRFYDEALYKLAWSYYRNDDFLKGIDAFDESVRYSDELVAQGKDPLELREEALTYIAISFTDPWSVEEQPDPVRSMDRANAYYKDRMKEPHVRDVYEKLGDTFRIIEGYDQAVESWRATLKNWPLHPRNPVVHQKIVAALEAKGDKDAADEESAALASSYRKGTDWYKANETNPEAMENQQRIGQRTLRVAAENTHRNAQLARKEWEVKPTAEGKERFIALYKSAADLYQNYLTEYPTSADIYDLTYRLADCYFFSEQYLKAVPHYRWVRDHRELGTAHYLPAALSIVQAYQAEVNRATKAGALVEPPVPSSADLKAMRPIQPIPVPAVYRELQNAYDEYQKLVTDPKTAPIMALAAAVVSFRFLQLDDAVTRFETVMARFCGTPEATRAKDGLLVIYDARGQDAKFTATNEKFISAKCGDEAAIATAKAQNQSKEFSKADELFVAKKYDEAALAFYVYYKTAADADPNLPVALYNSAVAYDRAGKPKTAIQLFKEFTTNRAPQFRNSSYYLEALYLTAVSFQKAFDYQSAVDVYLDVVKVSAEAGRTMPPGGRTLEQIRLDALFNAALLRELDRVYIDPRNQPGTGAASLYNRYARLEGDRRKRDRALWAVARVYESAQDPGNMVAAYDNWRRGYGRDPGNEQDYVFTYYNTAKVYGKRGNKKATDDARRATIQAWKTVGSPPGTTTAEMAAEYEFYYAEEFYRTRFEKYVVKLPAKVTEKSVKAMLDKLDAITDQTQNLYLEMAKYESPLHGMAALVRIGDIQMFSSLKLQETPDPPDLVKLDNQNPELNAVGQYREALDTLLAPKREAAKKQWLKVVSLARDRGVSNKWTKLAQERLHDYVSPDEFPVLRDELVTGTEVP